MAKSTPNGKLEINDQFDFNKNILLNDDGSLATGSDQLKDLANQFALLGELLKEQLTELRMTNRLLSEAFEIEADEADVNRDKF